MNTQKYNDGYRYYVFVAPGNIEYFYTLEQAREYAIESGGSIGEVW